MQEINELPQANGFQPLSLDSLQRRTEMLIVAGFGRSKRIWVLDSVRHIDTETEAPLQSAAVGSGTLFLLAVTSLYAECRAILARATFALRAQWYPFRKDHSQVEPRS